MNKVINITSSGIKQAIDDLVNENEMLQDKIYKLESIIKEVREYINKIPTQPVIRIFKKELLEILDKENNNEIIDYLNKEE